MVRNHSYSDQTHRTSPCIKLRSIKPFLMRMRLLGCVILAMIFTACNVLNNGEPAISGQYILLTHNGNPVTADKEVGLIGGKITLFSDSSIERKVDYRKQDGSDQQNVYEGTYKLKGKEVVIKFTESSGYVWTPPNAKIEGDTLTFYDPCVNCLGRFSHEEVYVLR